MRAFLFAILVVVPLTSNPFHDQLVKADRLCEVNKDILDLANCYKTEERKVWEQFSPDTLANFDVFSNARIERAIKLRSGAIDRTEFDAQTKRSLAELVDEQQQAIRYQQQEATQVAQARTQEPSENGNLGLLFCAAVAAFGHQPLSTNLNCQAAAMGGRVSNTSANPGSCSISGHSYDVANGNSYTCEHIGDHLVVSGTNLRTGSKRSANIASNGDMEGVDAESHGWRYTASTTEYMNYGTGQRCIGIGANRTCSP